MERIKLVRDDGTEFVMDGKYLGDEDWGITSCSGFGSIQTEITTEKFAIGDGEKITSEYVPKRPLDITAQVKHSVRYEEGRKNALRFFLPHRSYRVYATNDGVTRWIDARLQKSDCPSPKYGAPVKLTIALISEEDPYWKDMDSYGRDIAAKAGGMVLPYRVPVGGAFNTGYYIYRDTVALENTGDVPTDIHVTIKAYGEVVNPKITIGGAFIRMIMNLQSGDTLDIDLEKDRIQLNGVNCIGKTDSDSQITNIVIGIGTTMIRFSADSGEANMSVVVNFTPKYVGV